MRILCFGDSNTYGYDPRSYIGSRYGAEDRWVDLLARQTGWDVINAGLCGREIPRRTDSLPLPEKPDIFLVMLGTNDLLQGASAKEASVRMEAFLDQVLPLFRNVLLVAPPPMQRGVWVPVDELVYESTCLAEEYRLVAQKRNIPFVDTRHWNITLAFDGVHFTEEGHHRFAGKLAEYLI